MTKMTTTDHLLSIPTRAFWVIVLMPVLLFICGAAAYEDLVQLMAKKERA